MLGVHARRSVCAVAIPTARAFRANVPAASSLEVPASAVAGVQGGVSELDLANPRIAFQASSSYELARGVAVLTACSQPWLVRNAEAILSLSRRLLGGPLTRWKSAPIKIDAASRASLSQPRPIGRYVLAGRPYRPCFPHRPPTDWLLRHTVFAHFVAGETPEEIKPLLARLHSCGVGGILDYAAEADLGKAGAANAGPAAAAALAAVPVAAVAAEAAEAAAASRVPPLTNQPARGLEHQSEGLGLELGLGLGLGLGLRLGLGLGLGLA